MYTKGASCRRSGKMNQMKMEAQGKGSGGLVSRMRDNARPHASIPERRVDMWEALHSTFVREAKEAGTAGRPRCRTLFLAGRKTIDERTSDTMGRRGKGGKK